jgi:hypothetical protein
MATLIDDLKLMNVRVTNYKSGVSLIEAIAFKDLINT